MHAKEMIGASAWKFDDSSSLLLRRKLIPTSAIDFRSLDCDYYSAFLLQITSECPCNQTPRSPKALIGSFFNAFGRQ